MGPTGTTSRAPLRNNQPLDLLTPPGLANPDGIAPRTLFGCQLGMPKHRRSSNGAAFRLRHPRVMELPSKLPSHFCPTNLQWFLCRRDPAIEPVARGVHRIVQGVSSDL